MLAYRSVRKEEVVLARLRIGHTYLTHVHLLKKEDRPQCVFCDEPYTVKHLLLECADLLLIRQRYYSVDTMAQLFNTVSYDKILGFLKETGIDSKI